MDWDISHHLDIVVYAVIAVILLARLWSAFGRRNDEDQQRPNPFATPAPGGRDEEDTEVLPGRNRRNKENIEEGKTEETRRPLAALLVAPDSLAGGLAQVKQLIPDFDEKQFLQTARSAFSSIIEDFAQGDLARSTTLLGPSVRAALDQAIESRKQAGQVLKSRIARIKDAEVTAAKAEGARALITVQFVSEQENIVRDMHDAVMSGTPGQLEEITDLWVFARDAKSGWTVVETRS